MDVIAQLQSLDIFARVGREALTALADAAVVQRLHSGQWLYRVGEPSDHFHLLVHGRLQVIAGNDVLGLVSAGEPVGEMSVLSGEPRHASVRALRGSLVLSLPAQMLTDFLRQHADAALDMTRLVIARARKTATQTQEGRRGSSTLALLAATPDLPLQRLAEQLVSFLPAWPASRLISHRHIESVLGPGYAEVAVDDSEADLKVARWLADVERHHRHLLFSADHDQEMWGKRCLRQADRILVLASAAHPPSDSELLHSLRADTRVAPVELVLLRAEGDDSPYTRDWLEASGARAHYFLRPGSSADLAALARQISGRGVGLVLGGGGARGFAHIGLLRAMEQLGIAVDVVGGTSMGAFVGALAACDFDSVEMKHIARETFVTHNFLNDYTFPRVSLIRGQRFHNRLHDVFGDRKIEELRRTYYCISTNLSTGLPVVHDRGGLATWVGTSMSVPGVAPPIAWQGDLLCDGGVVNNLPTDVMHNLERGLIMASNVSSEDEVRIPGVGCDEPDQQALLKLRKQMRVPGFSEILMRSATLTSETIAREESIARADIYLRMPVTDIGMFDWNRLDELIERGYEYALEVLGNNPELMAARSGG